MKDIIVNQPKRLEERSLEMRQLFLLSFDDRDPLSTQISAYGWRVSSARRSDGLSARFVASGAMVAVVDLRQQTEAGLDAVCELTSLFDDGSIAILALANAAEQDDIAAKAFDAGASHFFDFGSPYSDLKTGLDYVYRYVTVINPGWSSNDGGVPNLGGEEWSFSKKAPSCYEHSPGLLDAFPQFDFENYPLTAIYRTLSSTEKLRVRGAMGRLRDGARQAAVPLRLAGADVIHHLHESGDRIFGRIERRIEDIDDLKGRDILSGLRNGSAARSWIRDKLRNGEQLGLAAFGVKNFKIINAAYGRATGDRLLRVIGERLLAETTDHSKDKCMIARLDGQNFAVAAVLDEGPDAFVKYANHLLEHIFSELVSDGRKIKLVARAGVAVGGESNDETLLIRRATLALAEAIAADAMPIKISGPSEQNIMLEQQLEGELAHAIQRGEIAIALQPQIRVITGQLTGAEALARWNHPELGMLGASTLFNVAEQAGLMDNLSAHIRELALTTGAQWPESLSFLRLSINVTASDLADRKFAERVNNDIANCGFPSDRVTLEITETELIDDIVGSSARLQGLRESGIRIAIDDFGTGYSSLSYLKDLPLDYLKIDSGLTSDISGSEKDQVVVRSIIEMAGRLGLEVIAEGVETEAQLETLAEQGCSYFQGFLRSGPLSPEEFEVFALRSN